MKDCNFQYFLDFKIGENSLDSRYNYINDDFRNLVSRIKEKIYLRESELNNIFAPDPVSYSIFDSSTSESYFRFFDIIEEYGELEDGWNDEESQAPDEKKTLEAQLGLLKLLLSSLPAPYPMILSEGTIGAYWRKGNKYLSVDFDDDGVYPWAGTDGEDFQSGTWVRSEEKVPKLLASALLKHGLGNSK